MPPVRAATPVVATHLDRVAAEVETLSVLADVLAWARDRRPPLRVLEIVTQDEFTHDVVLPFDGSHFLVFDAT